MAFKRSRHIIGITNLYLTNNTNGPCNKRRVMTKLQRQYDNVLKYALGTGFRHS